MNKIEELKPQIVWKYFKEILEIPRPSGHLEKISKYIINFAQNHNLEYKIDKVGNILIKKQAFSEEFKNKKTIILQSHLDMVPEKNDEKEHNFKEDSISAFIDGNWVTADGTTLGADNGIGIAGTLAVLDSNNIKHGPIEALFTVDEEIGLIGATEIEKDFITNDAILLNLDSEDDGQIFISSAGGFDLENIFKIDYKTTSETSYYIELNLTGMKGGHSGCDIHLNNGNAILTLIEFLNFIEKDTLYELLDIYGGSASNAIPRSATAKIILSDDSFLKDRIEVFKKEIKRFCDCPEFEISFSKKDTNSLQKIENKNQLFSFLKELPVGVIEMSHDVDGLVETSGNLASIYKTKDGINFSIVYSGRSSDDEKQRRLKEKIFEISKKYSVKTKISSKEYFGWKADLNSEILKISQKVYEKIFNEKPEILAIHAGLECGILKHIYPKLDIISFGPTIKFPHSPDEKIEILTVDKFWKLLKGILEY